MQEGPTPVSASIHAATTVTAGVFMIAFLKPSTEYSANALIVITFRSYDVILHGNHWNITKQFNKEGHSLLNS